MKKKAATTKRAVLVKGKPDDLASLIAEVRNLIESARRAAASTFNTLQVLTNFEIGRRIVEHEQKGEKRAGYGTELMKQLSARLTEEFGRGFSQSNLEYMRKFFLVWHDRVPQISQQPMGKLAALEISQKASGKLAGSEISRKTSGKLAALEISQKASGKLAGSEISRKTSGKLAISANGPRRFPFTLSWSHYVVLLSIKDPDERGFYYYDCEVKLPDENPTIGLLLCKEKKDAVVKLTLPKDANIHAREYQLYLPSKELLKAKLLEWSREQNGQP
jgi:DUF1016 N-terminal domain